MPAPGQLAHLGLDLAAYALGAQWYRRNLRRGAGLKLEPIQRWGVFAGALAGAALGSKLLYMLQYLPELRHSPASVWWSGKTIVGGLLGGLIGVEIAKRALEVRGSTGDAFVAPLIAGMIIGRTGCQLAGISDLTYGGPTSLPWGWDYGDGVPRHPVALYEIAGLIAIAIVLRLGRARLAQVAGDRFRAFMVLYLLLRLLLDGLKPPHLAGAIGELRPAAWGPLTAIQWACVAGLAYYLPAMRRGFGREQAASATERP